MAKIIEVPGVGQVSFPDDMSDDEIVKKIQSSRSDWEKETTYARSGSESIQSFTKPEIDYKTGAPWDVRAKASLKVTPEGKMNYLKSVYGDGNVAVNNRGTPFYMNPDSNKWTMFDEQGVSLKDFSSDLVGPAVDIIPPVATSIFTGNPWAVGGASAVSRATRQGLGALLPGEDNMTPGERVADVATAGLFGGLSQKGANSLPNLTDKARPHNLLANKVSQQMDSPYAYKGQRLAAQGGYDFSPGQLTGSRNLLTLEGLVRRHPFTSDSIYKFDLNNANKAVSNLKSVMDRIDSRGLSSISTGSDVRSAFTNATDKLFRLRKTQASIDYGKVDKLTKNAPVVGVKNLKSELESIIAEHDIPGGSAIANEARRVIKSISESSPFTKEALSQQKSAGALPRSRTPSGDLITTRQAMNLRSKYSEASFGKGNAFENLQGAGDRYLAKRLHDAVMRDIDDAASNPALGDVATALKEANANYAKNTTAIKNLGNTALGRVLKNENLAPEKIVESFYKMAPSEVKTSMSILDDASPETAQAVRRNLLEYAMKAAEPSGANTSAGVSFSPSKFITHLRKNDDKFKAAFSRKDYVDIKRTQKALERMADRANTDGSPTATLMMALDFAKGLVTTSPASTIRSGLTILGPKHIAKVMTTQEGRQALVTIAKTKPGTKAFTASSAIIAGILSTEADFQPYNAEPLGQ